jgi:hypothetical protein
LVAATRISTRSPRQPVQPPADRGDVGRVPLRKREARPDRSGLPDEQLRRAAGRYHRHGALAGDLQRRHRPRLLAGQVQRPPRRGQHHQPRCARQELIDHAGGGGQLLKHQQHLPAGQEPGHRSGSRALPAGVQAADDGLPHHLGVPDRGQRDGEHAVRERLLQRRGRGQRQPRLAGPAGAGQRHQPDPWPQHRGAQLLNIVIPADQGRRRHRQAGRRAQAFQPGEPIFQARRGQLVEMFGCGDVLEPVKAQTTERHPGRQPCLRQPPRLLRHHHLAAVGRGRDPRRPVHVHPDESILVPDRLAGVQAHPDPDRHAIRPGVPGQRALPGHAAAHRLANRGEHHEEAVPLGAHLLAPAVAEGRAQQGALSRRRLGVPVAKTIQQRR